MNSVNGDTNRMLIETSQGNITNYHRPSNPFARNQQPANISYSQNLTQNPIDQRNNKITRDGGYDRKAKVNEWVGEYMMGKENAEQQRERNLHDLA